MQSSLLSLVPAGWTLGKFPLPSVTGRAAVNSPVHLLFCSCALLAGQILKSEITGGTMCALNVLIDIVKMVKQCVAPLFNLR